MRSCDRNQFADLGIRRRRKEPRSLLLSSQVSTGNQTAHAVSDKINLGNGCAVRVLKSRDVLVELSAELFNRDIAIGAIVEINDGCAV